MKQYTLNFQDDTDLDGEMMTSSSPEDFPANPTAKPESDLGTKTSDTSGRRCLESFQRLSQPTSWAKMFMDSLIGTKVWSSKKCVLTWRILGTQYNRYYCQLRASVRPTTECEYSLLPTPSVMDIRTDIRKPEERSDAANQGGCSNLREWAGNGMLPTPIAGDWKGQLRRDGTANMLSGKASLGMLPTPAARDYKGANSIEHMENQNGNKVNHMGQLPNYIKYHSGNDSHQLNPQFVAEMMGFPTDWTILPFLGGE